MARECHLFTASMKSVKEAIAQICASKRAQRIVPALATELEIQRVLKAQGVTMSFNDIAAAVDGDPQIRKRRLLRYNGYEYANDAEANA